MLTCRRLPDASLPDGRPANSHQDRRVPPPGPVLTVKIDGERPGGPRWPTAIVLICYGALALFLTWSWWTPLGMRITAINSDDMTLFSWLLNWTPHSLFNGQFPLFSAKLNAPTGINLMWNNGMALPGLLFAPVTGLFGGLATVTALTTLGWPARPQARTGACGRCRCGCCRPRWAACSSVFPPR